MKKIIFILVLMFTCNSLVFAHTSYNKGDVVKFADANWIVMKDSSIEDDYIVLLKDKVLTHDEIGEYATDDTGVMAYGDSAEYSTSNVKKMLENIYINKLGTNNLKEIEGYKIRLLNQDEVISAFNNYTYNGLCWLSTDAENWIYKDIDGNYEGEVWSMTQTNSIFVRTIAISGNFTFYGNIAFDSKNNVRPVINLLKSSIEIESNNNNNTVDKPESDDVSDDSINNDYKTKEVVKVPNTLMRVSMLVFICGICTMILGVNAYILIMAKKIKK